MKKFIKKILNFKKLKDENKLLKEKIEELEKSRIPLINLKNKYLSDLRCKNLEIGRLKKKIKKAKYYIKSFEYYIPEDDKPELLEILGDKECVLY